MPTERELNVLVAEQVMGWRLEDTGHPVKFWIGPDGLLTGWCDREWPDPVDGADPYDVRWGSAPETFSGKGVWRPSTDITAAWPVFEFVVNQGFTMSRIQVDGKSRWLCDFKDDPLHSIFAYGETVPLAICRAALRAVGVSNDCD